VGASRSTPMLEVDVLATARTPVGRHGGALAHIRVDDLAAVALREAVARAGVESAAVGEVYAGIVNGSGEAMGNLARHAARLAGLPAEVAGITMNRYCASSMSAVHMAATAINSGLVDVAVAVGAESMSRSTWPIPKLHRTFVAQRIEARDAMFSGAGGPQHPELEARGDMVEMTVAAQHMVGRFGLTREALDCFALRSHERAAAAAARGDFDAELTPVPGRDGAPVAADETIRRETSMERLGRLGPYDPSAPDITAGNSSPVNDGASAIVLASPTARARLGLDAVATLTGIAVTGVDPLLMGTAPAAALSRLATPVADADIVELHEAFAAIPLAAMAELELDGDRVNPVGGALALGHALGNSGTRQLTTLIGELHRRGGGTGLAAMCVGGGMGVATSLEVQAA
jgi:acetyl-CoA acetyltransferase family protein